jgi:hypothetical protein
LDVGQATIAAGIQWRVYLNLRKIAMPYPPEFLQLVDEYIALANRQAEGGQAGEASAAILFAAGRYNAFNFLSNGGSSQEQDAAVEFYVSEYRKALLSNMAGVVGPVIRSQD